MPTYDVTIKTTYRVETKTHDMPAAIDYALQTVHLANDEYAGSIKVHPVEGSEVIRAEKL